MEQKEKEGNMLYNVRMDNRHYCRKNSNQLIKMYRPK